MQNDPDQVTKSMGNRPDSLIMSKARHQSAIDNLENGPFRLGGGIGGLIENAPHVAITFRGAVSLGYAGAFFISGACSHPVSQLLGGRKPPCLAPSPVNPLFAGFTA